MPNAQISAYMRKLQGRSSAARWANKTPAERSAAMKAIRAKAKPKTNPKNYGLDANPNVEKITTP